jgi:hypothetical protein
MPRRQTDYVNLYFGFVVWRAIFSVGAKALGGLVLVLYFILYSIWPDQAPQLFGDFVICAIAAFALAIVYLIGRLIYCVFFPPKPPTVAEIEQSLGWTPNPKGDWFDDRKRPLWRREGDQWVHITYED